MQQDVRWLLSSILVVVHLYKDIHVLYGKRGLLYRLIFHLRSYAPTCTRPSYTPFLYTHSVASKLTFTFVVRHSDATRNADVMDHLFISRWESILLTIVVIIVANFYMIYAIPLYFNRLWTCLRWDNKLVRNDKCSPKPPSK